MFALCTKIGKFKWEVWEAFQKIFIVKLKPDFAYPIPAFAFATILFLILKCSTIQKLMQKIIQRFQISKSLWGKKWSTISLKLHIFSSFSLLCSCLFKLQCFKYGSINYNVLLHIWTLFTFSIGSTPIGEKMCLKQVKYNFHFIPTLLIYQ